MQWKLRKKFLFFHFRFRFEGMILGDEQRVKAITIANENRRKLACVCVCVRGAHGFERIDVICKTFF